MPSFRLTKQISKNVADTTFKHKSYVFVLPESRDDPKFVYAVLKELATCLKDLGHQVNYVHSWTDSSMFQYRNKTIFSVVAAHKELFGYPAS